MKIRTFQPGDEAIQVQIYNAAAGNLPRFKPATVQEVQRRARDKDFDRDSRFYVEDGGQVVAYANFSGNSRVSFPWCLPGFEHHAEPLFDAVLKAMRARGHSKVFAAYRGDWPTVADFLMQHGFIKAREMVNFVVDLLEMPTPAAKPSSSFTSVRPEDVPSILTLAPAALRVQSPAELEKHLFQNPYFTHDALFALRSRQDGQVLAAGIAVYEPTYANANFVDSAMPCFRLGAFGTEGMQAKRIKGLFSFVAKPGPSLTAIALDLMGHAAFRLRDYDDVNSLAAQVASDVPELLNFYERNFRRQGSFPVFEKPLN